MAIPSGELPPPPPLCRLLWVWTDSIVYRIRYQVMNASPINYVAEAAKLAELIKAYEI